MANHWQTFVEHLLYAEHCASCYREEKGDFFLGRDTDLRDLRVHLKREVDTETHTSHEESGGGETSWTKHLKLI